jgi:Carbohydrate esterase 2 N-terminal/GDSL-like Lipase/Acylhydrolase family
MKKITASFFLLSIYFTACTQNNHPDFVSASNANIHYTGRFDFTDKEKPVFMYSGCSIQTAFTGTSITLRLQDDSLKNWFTVKLDDSLFVFPSNKKESVYHLAENLTNKKHTIEISRRTEWHAGNTVFIGFEIDKGKALLPVEKPTRMIEFIGDSYTCGYGNEGKSREEHFAYETENNYLTYGTITARAFNAAYVSVCRSGIGMYQAYGGDKKFVQPMLYDEIVVGSKAVWDYTNNQPQVVLIELGTNDFSKPLDSAAYVKAYIQFVQKIRRQYPDAKIICAAGPDSPDDMANKFQTHVKAVTNHFAASDKHVYYFYFGTLDCHGSDWHPNIKEHEQMAGVLIPFIKEITKW